MFKVEFRFIHFASLLIFLSISLPCFAATTETVKKVTGYGKTQDAALANALVEAVSQIEGIGISKIRAVEKDLSSLTIISTGGQTITSTVPVSKETILGRVRGYIKSYDVISSNKEADGWKVVVKATLEQYKALQPERDGMLKVVVYPFRIQGQQHLGVESSYIQDQISNNLITHLTQTGKFRVLDRQYMLEYGSEVMQIQSALSQPREALSIGKKLGADYILVGRVAYLELEEKKGGYYNDTASQFQITGDIEYRLVEVATQEISLADTYSFTAQQKELRKLLRKKTKPQALKEILDVSSRGIASAVIDNTFPIKVLKINSDATILLNQGGKRVKVGDILNVYSGSSLLKDPDTGLDIKVRGSSVAELEISEVQLQYSSARIVSGSKNKIMKNALVYRSDDGKVDKSVPPPRQTPGSSDAPVDWSSY